MDTVPQIPKPKAEPPRLGGFSLERHAIQVARQDLYRRLKSLWFSLLFLGSAGLSAWTFDQSWQKGGSALPWYWFGIALILLLASFGFSALLFKFRSIAFLSLIAAAFFIYPLRNTFSYLTLSYIWLLPFSGFLLSAFSIRQHSYDTLKIKFARLVRSNSGAAFAGLAILFAVFYYSVLESKGMPQKPFFTETSVRGMLKNLEWGIQPFYPRFSADMSIDDLILILSGQLALPHSKLEISNLELLERFAKPEEREKIKELAKELEPQLTEDALTKETKRTLLSNLSKIFGQPLSGKEKLSEVLYRYFSKLYEKIPESTKQTAFWVWIAIVFFSIWSLGFILRALAGILGWILLQFFIGLKFVKLDHEPADRQVLIIS